jgi:proline dehydrogenase
MTRQTNPLSTKDFTLEAGYPHQTRRELRRGRLLFSAMLVPPLARAGILMLKIALQLRLPLLRTALRPTLFAQFCGGESIEETHQTLERLRSHRVGAILDYVAERGTNERDFVTSQAAILATIAALDIETPPVMAVFKATAIIPAPLLEKVSAELATIAAHTVLPPPDELHGLTDGERAAWRKGLERVEELCAKAAAQGASLMIDAEESWLQGAVDALAVTMMRRYNRGAARIFTTIQFYRTGRVAQLELLLADAKAHSYVIGVKAVRGAYLEKERARAAALGYPSPVHASKEATDTHFDRGVELALANPDWIHLCVATHNTASALAAANLARHKNARDTQRRLCFSQLFGMCDYLSFNVAHQGFSVLKYLPYGPIPEAIPYLLRRAEENASVQGQAGQEVELLGKALERRGASHQNISK